MSASETPSALKPCFMILNWRRHSSIIANAALPTAFIVIAQKTMTSMTPMNRPQSTDGFSRLISK